MKIAIIGSSTGGPYILEQIFTEFPKIPVVIIIVQHLPLAFTEVFKGHISALTKMNVVIPTQGYVLQEHEILIAPAGLHLVMEHNRIVHLTNEEKLHGVKPAIDYTMLSTIKRKDDMITGILLTGMGQDGALGIAHIHDIGGDTIVQDPNTAPIRSMPQSAIDTGKVVKVLTPKEISKSLIAFGKN